MVALPTPRIIGHREWASQPVVLDTTTRMASGRKIDPTYNMHAFRARIRGHVAGSGDGDVMDAAQEKRVLSAINDARDVLFEITRGRTHPKAGTPFVLDHPAQAVTTANAALARLEAKVAEISTPQITLTNEQVAQIVAALTPAVADAIALRMQNG